jgi:hypothetical protein
MYIHLGSFCMMSLHCFSVCFVIFLILLCWPTETKICSEEKKENIHIEL